MLNGRRIRALRSSTSGHGSFRTRLLQRSSIVPPEAHYKAPGPRVSHTGSLFFNKIRRPPVRLGRNHVERRTRKKAVCGQRTETPPKKRVKSCEVRLEIYRLSICNQLVIRSFRCAETEKVEVQQLTYWRKKARSRPLIRLQDRLGFRFP